MRHKSVDPRCSRCGLKPALCMCALLPRLPTTTRVVLVTPAGERDKSTNTGRLLEACLPNSALALYGPDLPPLVVDKLWPTDHRPVLLFPVRGAPPLSPSDEPTALIALDATWRQANRMRKRFLVAGVGVASLPDGPPSELLLRTAPHEGGLSTLEAVGRALTILEGRDLAGPLLEVLRVFRDRTLWLRGTLPKAAVTGGVPDALVRTRL